MVRSLLFATLMTAATTGCATGESGPGDDGTRLGRPTALAAGESLKLPGDAALRYLKVEDDSRCRPGEQCIWAGDAKLVFEFTRPGQPPRNLTVTYPPAAGDSGTPLGGWTLQVTDLDFAEPPVATVHVAGP